MLLVEERLFPGEELAAVMMAATVGGESGGSGTDATSTTTGEDKQRGGRGRGAGGDTESKSLRAEKEGGWGEDGTAAGSLSHLVECMLEVGGGRSEEFFFVIL